MNVFFYNLIYYDKSMNKFQKLKTCFVSDITRKLNISINFTDTSTIKYIKSIISRESNKRYKINSFRLIKNNQEINDNDLIGDKIQDGDKLFVIGKLKRNLIIHIYYSNTYLDTKTVDSKKTVKEFKDIIKKLLDEEFNIREKLSFAPNLGWFNSFMWQNEDNNLLEEYLSGNGNIYRIYINSLI